MKTIKKKLILAIIATLSLCLSAVTATYAWFSMNDSTWVDEFELDIRASDHLLIGADGEFKQALSNEDAVKAINNLREEGQKITKLSDISLTDVVSFDGVRFLKQEFAYDDNNKASLQYVSAEENNYVKMRLYFKVESSIAADSTAHRPNYELHFKQPTADQTGIKATQFTAETQNLVLFNSLTMTDDVVKKSGDTIEVNPANAVRLSVKGDEVDRIIDPNSNSGLGSYAMKNNCEQNAMYTYFNHIHGNCLKPMDEVAQSPSELEGLLGKLTNNLDGSLGTFVYDASNGSYNTIALDIAFWIEGFDADNLIGLKTTAMKCLLSFAVEEV